jgi:hypothetical protein
MSTDVESTVVRMSQNNRRILVRRGLIAALILICAASAYSIFLVIRFHTHVAAFQKQNAYLETVIQNDQGELVREAYGVISGHSLIPAPFLRYHRSLFAIYLGQNTLSDPEEIDELFRMLPTFPKLKELHLEGLLIDRERATAIAHLPNLEVIYLRSCQIEESCLSLLLKIEGLIYLNLANSEFQEAELEILSQGSAKERLVGLSLSNCKVSDRSATVLSQCRNLEFLELDGTQITDRGLKQLARLRQLKVLILDHTGVTDVGVAYLSSTPNLVELSLSNTNASDAMLETLKQENPALRVSDD